MKFLTRFAWLLPLLFATPVCGATPSNLQARVSQGQVFLTFTEVSGSGLTYNVYRSTSPITNVSGLTPIATLPQNSGLNLYTNQRFIVTDNGSPLAAGVGLFVYTTHNNGGAYYAVTTSADSTVTAGVNATTSPTAEMVAAIPGPVQLGPAHDCGGHICVSYMQWEDAASWAPAFGYYGRRFDVVVAVTGATIDAQQALQMPAGLVPLFLDLHSAPQFGYIEPDDFLDTGWHGVFIKPVDYSYNYGPDPYSGEWQVTTAWFGYKLNGEPVKATEDRIVRYVRWVMAQAQFHVDTNRVYVKGASMGGGGSMKVGFHYPDLFAGIASSIAWVAWYDWGNMWGGMPGHTVVGTSFLFDDYQDGERWVAGSQTGSAHAVPPITLTFRQDDNIIPQGHYATFLPALDSKRQAYCAQWKAGGHQVYWLEAGACDITRYRKDEAYISFSGATTNDTYVVNGADGQANLNLDWSSSLHSFGPGTDMVDTAASFKVSLVASTQTSTTLTVHNAQHFQPAAGTTVHWQQGTWNGDVQVNPDGTISVPVVIGTNVSVLELGQTSQQLPHITSQNIPDFAAFPTKTAAVDGSWTSAATWSPAGVPTATDIVRIPAGRTVTITAAANAASVGISGTLRQTAGTFSVTNLLPYTGGLFDMSGSAIVVIRNTPIDTTVDPQSFGTGILGVGGKIVMNGAVKTPFMRAAADVEAGGSCVAVATAPTGWQVGDHLVFPATEQWYLDAGPYSADWDETTLTSVNGTNVCFTAVPHRHHGVRDQQGLVASWYYIANVTRSIVVRSENPQGTRGHFLATDRSDVTLQYVEFDHFGRTTVDPLDPITNVIGRYGIHFHHLDGPVTPQPNGKQFTVKGVAVNHTRKWAIDVHDTSYGIVQDSVMYDQQGSALMTEDGNEINNVFDNNYMIVSLGPGNGGYGTLADWATGGSEREDAARNPNTGDRGWGGECYWTRGVLNTFTHNVCANANAFGVYIYPTNLGIISLPDFQGADHMHRHNVDSNTLPMAETAHNTIQFSANGWSIWNICTSGIATVSECAESVLDDSEVDFVGRHGVYVYGANRLRIRNYRQYGDLSPWSWSPYVYNHGIWYGDYESPNASLENIHIEGLRTGIIAPFKPGDVTDIYGVNGTPFVISNSYLANEWNIAITTMYAVGGGDGGLSQRHTFINDVRHGPMNTTNFPGGPQWESCTICMSFDTSNPNVNIIQKDEVTVTAHNGVAGDDFRLYYSEQAPNFVVPQSTTGLLGAPVAGLTNAQLWQQYGLAVAGAVAPCATTRAGIHGFVCPSTGSGQTPQPPGTAVITP